MNRRTHKLGRLSIALTRLAYLILVPYFLVKYSINKDTLDLQLFLLLLIAFLSWLIINKTLDIWHKRWLIKWCKERSQDDICKKLL